MKSQRRFSGVSVVLCLVTMSSQVFANPVGESLRAGRARFDRSAPGSLSIQQDTDKLIINWREFSIAAGETTRFIQPSATSIALNRVVTANPSRLFGNLEANGKVYLINPNGILVGRGGAVNTRGFVASTLDVSDASFLSGAKLRLSGDSEASVVNEGSIQAIGGDVFMVGRTVENSGAIQAGTVGLGAGSEVVIVPTGRERLSVIAGNPNGGQAAKGVNNEGTIEAVSAELKAAGGNIYALAVNNGGIIRATGVRREGGRVFLSSEGGDIENSGTIVANNATGGGGFVSLAGGHNDSAPSTVINSGTIEARGERAGTEGGEVRMTGDYVGLFGASVIDVSGHAGGGTALVGGDYHGANPSVQNAERTYVSSDSQVLANAIVRGDGGKVVIWADEVTRFHGAISARGGELGGDGGRAETSGKISLSFDGRVDLTAPHGRIGNLLLDPTDLTITDTAAGTGSLDGNLPFVAAGDGGAAESVSRGALEAVAGTADMTLEADNNITINSLGGDNTLNLQTGTGHSVTFRADADNSGSGNFTMNVNDKIETQGGSITIIGNSLDIGDIDTTAGGAPGGFVLLRGNEMTFDNTTTIVAGSGNVTYEPKTAGTVITLGSGTGGLNITENNLNKVTTSGLFQIGNGTAGNITLDADIDLGSKNVALVTGGTINFGAGDTLTTSGNATLTAGTGIPGDSGTTAHVDANIVTLQVTGAGTIGTDASNPFRVSANELVATTAGAVGDDIFLTEASTLTGLDINAGAGNVTLRLAEGSVSDTDAAVDIVANSATITLSDANDNGDDFGTLANPIGTSVNDLTVNTSAGANHGNQFITEANGLTALNLNAGSANINLTVTLGGVTDSDGAADITAASATVILSDATAQDFGSLANAINTSVGGLSVDTSAGNGSQFITEANGLTALDLNAGLGNVNLTLTLGSVADGDGAVDITAASAAVTLSDVTARDFGASGNHIGTSVDSLSVDTSAGNGDQFVTEANGLSSLNLNAGSGNVNLTVTLGSVLDTDGATDITADQATVTLLDATAQAFGTSGDEIATSVNSLTVDSSAGGGDQFIVEANGLTALNLNAGAGNVNLTLTAGGITDSDVGTDITAVDALVTLNGAIGAAGPGNAIQTSVDSLSVDSGNGDQFLSEANGLTALNLSAGSGSVNLTLALGTLTDADAAVDIAAANATVILSDVTAQDFGSLANPINTSVGGLSVSTAAGDGSQFISEANGLTGLNLNAGLGNVNLTVLLGGVADTDGATDITAANAIIALNDATAQSFGASGNRIGTSVTDLSVDTSAGGGDQFITEANGLTGLNLNAGAGDVTLTVTAGAVADADLATDITADQATVTLSAGSAQDFGSLASPIGTAVNDLSVSTAAGNGNQFINQANGLTALNLNAGAGDVNLTLTLGGIADTDGSADITAGNATVLLSDVTAQTFGSLANPINTSVGGLSVNTAAGGGDQFITEANGLTGLDLNAGAGDVNLTLTLGAVADTDGTDDITADQATVTLSEAAVRDFGALGNPIATSVNDLSVSTAAGNGSQFITEANGLTALNLNAGGGNVNLTLTLGALVDTDAAADITAANATVILSDATAQDFGATGNLIGTSVGGLSVDTSAGGGSQFITEANGLTGLNLNAGAGDVNLTVLLGGVTDADGGVDITAANAVIALNDATVQNFGAPGNRIGTSVDSLSVDTSAGGGDQFITEANGLTALNLDAGAGDVNLALTLGGVTDTDATVDITAGDLIVTLSDAALQNFGSAANVIQTSVGTLSVDTSAGGGSQFITEANGLTALNLNAGGGNVNLTLANGSLIDSDGATDIDAFNVSVGAIGTGSIGDRLNPIKIDASGTDVMLDGRGVGGGVHVEVAQPGNVTFTDSLPNTSSAVQTLFTHGGTTFRNFYVGDLTVKANGSILSTMPAGTSLLVPNGTLTLNAVGGSIGGGIANPLAIDANTLNASAATGLSLSEAGNVTLGSISSASGAFFVQAGNTLTFNNSTVINAGVGGTAILVANGIPGVSVTGNPTMTSRYLLYALNADLTDPPVVLDSTGNNPTIGGLVANRIDSPINFNPATPDPFGDLLNHFVFSLKANPPTDPSLYIDIPVEVFQPVSIVFGDYDPTKFGEVGDLWMSSSELYEIERKAGQARKALPPQVNRTKYYPEGK